MDRVFYSTDELAEMFNVSSRTVRRHISNLTDELSSKSQGYKVPENIALEIAQRNNYSFEKKLNGQVVRAEYFTEKEYEEFYKRLEEYPRLKENIFQLVADLDYHKRSAESHQRQMEMILTLMNQRNLIEGADKGYISKKNDG